MKLKVSFLLVLVLVASSTCAPFGYGLGVGGNSQTKWGADAEGNAGLEEHDNIIGARGKARGGGYVKSVKSVTGGAYVASKDGTGVGIGGTSVFDNGAGFDVGEGGKAGVDTEKKTLFGDTKGYLDKEAHSNLRGNVDLYDTDKLKYLAASGPDKKRGDYMGSTFDEW